MMHLYFKLNQRVLRLSTTKAVLGHCRWLQKIYGQISFSGSIWLTQRGRRKTNSIQWL